MKRSGLIVFLFCALVIQLAAFMVMNVRADGDDKAPVVVDSKGDGDASSGSGAAASNEAEGTTGEGGAEMTEEEKKDAKDKADKAEEERKRRLSAKDWQHQDFQEMARYTKQDEEQDDKDWNMENFRKKKPPAMLYVDPTPDALNNLPEVATRWAHLAKTAALLVRVYPFGPKQLIVTADDGGYEQELIQFLLQQPEVVRVVKDAAAYYPDGRIGSAHAPNERELIEERFVEDIRKRKIEREAREKKEREEREEKERQRLQRIAERKKKELEEKAKKAAEDKQKEL